MKSLDFECQHDIIEEALWVDVKKLAKLVKCPPCIHEDLKVLTPTEKLYMMIYACYLRAVTAETV